jgi:hypothetical protein
MINKKKSSRRAKSLLLAMFVVCLVGFTATGDRAWSAAKCEFEVSFRKSLSEQPVTGRVFLFVCKTGTTEPVLHRQSALWGVDVEKLVANKSAKLDSRTPGYPVVSLQDLPAGDYYVQALLNVYTEFHRSDGHVIWAHMDQWEGQKFNRSPGNFKSLPVKVHLDAKSGYHIRLVMDQVIPPVEIPADTEWVKRIKIKSELLSKFWGHPFYLGAVILLPKGYEEHPDVYYPVQYDQGHFGLGAPNGFATEAPAETDVERAARLRRGDQTGYEFYQEWDSANFPRMLLVKFLHPTPYYDDSYAVNSANNGPFGDAIMTELIPYIETHFRIIRQPYARMVSGGSTGGWEALALQVYHPEFFGATWVFYPDPVDFSRYGIVDIYNDDNAFTTPGGDWSTQERPFSRTPDGQVRRTLRQTSQLESVLGSKRRSGEQLAIWEATYGPVGDDGYPKPLWDPITGKIDHEVALYMRDHNYDLAYYLKSNWPTLGPLLAGKLKFYCGDEDGLYLNLAVYKIQELLEELKNPGYGGSFEYGRPLKGHGWQPMTDSDLSRMMAARVQEQTPAQDRPLRWLY